MYVTETLQNDGPVNVACIIFLDITVVSNSVIGRRVIPPLKNAILEDVTVFTNNVNGYNTVCLCE